MADFRGLRERTDGGGGQDGQVHPSLLRFNALGKRRFALVCAFGQVGQAGFHRIVVNQFVGGAVSGGGVGGFQLGGHAVFAVFQSAFHHTQFHQFLCGKRHP